MKQKRSGIVPENPKKCAWVRKKLIEYIAWSPNLSDANFNEINKHLFSCSQCHHEFKAMVDSLETKDNLDYRHTETPVVKQIIEKPKPGINDSKLKAGRLKAGLDSR